MEGFLIGALPLAALAVGADGGKRANRSASELAGGNLDALWSATTTEGHPLVDWLALASAPGTTASDGAHGAAPDGPARTTVTIGDGPEHRVLEVSAQPDGYGGALALLVDATEAHRRGALLDAVADSVFVVGEDGRLTWQSDELRRRTAGREAIGSFALGRVHPEDMPRVMDLSTRAGDLPDARTEMVIRSRALDDDHRWERIRIRGTPRRQHPLIHGDVVQVDNLDEGERVEDLGEAGDDLFSLADALPLGVALTDGGGRVLWANRRCTDVLPMEEATSILADEVLERFAPDDRGAYARQVRAALTGRSDPPATMALADERWVVVHGVPRQVDGANVGVVLALLDVTAEVEARQQVDRVTALLESSADIVVVLTPDLELRYANDAALTLLGEPPQRLLGDEALPAPDRLLTQSSLRRLREEVLPFLAGADSWRGELNLRTGDDGVLPVSVLCLARRRGSQIESIGLVARDISDLKAAHDRLTHLASHDPLTGLPNRSQVFDRLGDVGPRVDPAPVAVLFCDLDGFKAVNDRFGHLAGDRVLAAVAERLRQSVRPNDLVARVGGDEFAVVPADATDPAALEGLAQRLVEAMSPPFSVDDDEAYLGVSVGVVLAERPPESIDRLLSVADRAMYEAKARGRGRWVLTRWDETDT